MIADRLSAYAQSLRYEDLPADVVHEVKRRVLDSLACAFGAWTAEPCVIARRIARAVAVPNGATLWGTAHKTLPDLAAFANGALVRHLGFNDTYLSKEPAHPSDNISAVLATGESIRASGKQVIAAIVLAYETQCRICDAATLRPRDWDHVTCGPFSAALGAAKVLKLSQAKTVHAVNLAGEANIALRQTWVDDRSMWKACASANAARNGVFAALLAAQGMTGPSPIFEGGKGLSVFGGKKVPYKILDTYITHYPVAHHVQSAVEAALVVREEMLNKEGRSALSGIAAIEIGSYDMAIAIIGHGSLPYCVAVALLDGTVTVQSFDAKRLADPQLLALLQKIRVSEQEEFIGWYPKAIPTRVTARTARGNEYVKQVDYPLGHPRNPLSDREIEEKFRSLAVPMFDRARAGLVIDLVWKLEAVKDIGALMPVLDLSSAAPRQEKSRDGRKKL